MGPQAQFGRLARPCLSHIFSSRTPPQRNNGTCTHLECTRCQRNTLQQRRLHAHSARTQARKTSLGIHATLYKRSGVTHTQQRDKSAQAQFRRLACSCFSHSASASHCENIILAATVAIKPVKESEMAANARILHARAPGRQARASTPVNTNNQETHIHSFEGGTARSVWTFGAPLLQPHFFTPTPPEKQ